MLQPNIGIGLENKLCTVYVCENWNKHSELGVMATNGTLPAAHPGLTLAGAIDVRTRPRSRTPETSVAEEQGGEAVPTEARQNLEDQREIQQLVARNVGRLPQQQHQDLVGEVARISLKLDRYLKTGDRAQQLKEASNLLKEQRIPTGMKPFKANELQDGLESVYVEADTVLQIRTPLDASAAMPNNFCMSSFRSLRWTFTRS